MKRLHRIIGCGLGALWLLAVLAACGSSEVATNRPVLSGNETPTNRPSEGTRTPGLGGPPASPIFERPTGTITPPFARPTGTITPIFERPTGTITPPFGSGPPTITPSAKAVAPNSDGGCPNTHPIKAAQIGPVKTYFLSDSTGYANARASECFATEADAEGAGYRKAAR
jgi:hypothetical protein